MFDLLQPTHLLFVLVVALVVLGPGRLIEMSRSLGQYVRELQDYRDEFKEGLLGTFEEDEYDDEDENDDEDELEEEFSEEKAIEERESKG
jgi:Sec-independent protein translocase protein TatA